MEIRPISEDEFEPFALCAAASFGYDAPPEERNKRVAVFEFDRTLAVLDGQEITGTGAIFSFGMTVPGGASLPAAGVTWISVKPTHRRRGILRQIMRRQLDDVRDRGEPFAALWASESQIYGRFGYGLAAESAAISIDRRHSELAFAPAASGRTRLVDRETALSAWPAIFERARPSRPGMYTRHTPWWENRVLRLHDHAPPGFGGPFLVQFEEEGVPTGYLKYRRKPGSDHGAPAGTLLVAELVTTTGAAYVGLWRYAFGVDLVTTIEAHLRPVDEPLWWMLHDPRRLVREPSDSLWLRLVDVPAALSARRYPVEGRLVFEVADDFCPWVAGRYELVGGPEGATCRTTAAEPAISLGVAELGAVYMGGARLQALARAGRVAGDPANLRLADAMFAWDPLPWCPEVF